MVILTIIGVIIAVLVLWFTITTFNQHCNEKFDHRFFTLPILITLGVSGGLFIWGGNWYVSSVAVYDSGFSLMGIIFNKETLNGLLLITIAILIYSGIAIYNFIQTNWIYGLFGTIVQFGLLSIMAYFGLMLLVIYFFLSILGSAGAKHVYVVNK